MHVLTPVFNPTKNDSPAVSLFSPVSTRSKNNDKISIILLIIANSKIPKANSLRLPRQVLAPVEVEAPDCAGGGAGEELRAARGGAVGRVAAQL